MDEKEVGEYLLSKILRIHMTLHHLASFLPFSDLLTCTQVSKSWCKLFRKYIHERRSCNIHLDLAWNSPCVQLQQLDDLLLASREPLPINGFTCSNYYSFAEACSHQPSHSRLTTKDSFPNILAKVKLTSCGVLFCDEDFFTTGPSKDCPALHFLTNLLKYNRKSLQTLEVVVLQCVNGIYNYIGIEDARRGDFFPQVQKLNFIDSDYFYSSNVAELVRFCPQLVDIRGVNIGLMFLGNDPNRPPETDSRFTQTIPITKYKFVTECMYFRPTALINLAKERPKLRTLCLTGSRTNNTLVEDPIEREEKNRADIINQFIALKMLLSSSWKSLKKIYCNIAVLLMIYHYIRENQMPLVSLTVLNLTCGSISHEEFFSYFRIIDFSFWMPKLKSLSFMVRPREILEPIDSKWIRHRFEDCNNYFVTPSVTQLHLYKSLPEAALKAIGIQFPKIDSFFFHSCQNIPGMTQALWKTQWNHLHEVHFSVATVNVDLDEVFFGLASEEREFIEQEDENIDIQDLHHVSSSYSVFNLPNLRMLQLQLGKCWLCVGSYADSVPSQPPRHMPLISSTTALKIKRYLPALKIQVDIEEVYLNAGWICNPKYARIEEYPVRGKIYQELIYRFTHSNTDLPPVGRKTFVLHFFG